MAFVHDGLWESLKATLWLAAVLWICGRSGGALLQTIRPWAGLHREEEALFSAGLGLALLSLGVLALGSVFRLSLPGLFLVLIALWSVPLFFRAERKNTFSFLRLDGMPRWAWALLGTALALAWLRALAPPTLNDALNYHLRHPKIFVETGKIAFIPLTRESLWPYLTQMLYTAGLLLQGTMLATLFHWLFYGMGLAAVYCFARRFLDRTAAVTGALIYAFTPVVFVQAGEAYIDLALGFYVFVSVYAFLLYVETGERGLALLSGLFCGAAAGAKFFGLTFMAVLALLLVWQARKDPRAIALFAAGACVFSVVWYARSWALLGNPVYPFFQQAFAGRGFEPPSAPGIGTGWRYFPLLLWNMTMMPRRFGGEWIGPWFAMLLPLLVVFRPRVTRVGAYVTLFCLVSAAVLFKQGQYVRFFIPLIPFLAVGAALAFRQALARGGWVRRAAVLVFGATLLLHTGVFLYRTRDAALLWFGRLDVEQYLLRNERSYRGHLFLARALEPGQTVFNASEPRLFYNQIDGMTANNTLFRDTLEGRYASVNAYLEQARPDYLWLLKGVDPEVLEFAEKENYRPVYAYDFTEKPHTYEYVFYRRPA